MAEPRDDLSVLTWVREPGLDLARYGVDPHMRAHYCGHETRLAPQWIQSIGAWGNYETGRRSSDERHPLFDFRDPDLARVPVDSGAYRMFKHRHGLKTRSEFASAHGQDPWRRAELSWRAHDWMQHTTRRLSGTYASIGVACREVVQMHLRRDADPRCRLGLLPVEVVAYTLLFDSFLAHYEMRIEHWEQVNDDTKEELWLHEPDGRPWTIDARTLHLPAVLALPGYPLPAADERQPSPAAS